MVPTLHSRGPQLEKGRRLGVSEGLWRTNEGTGKAPGSLLSPLQEPSLGIPSTAQDSYHVCIITHKLREVGGQDASEKEPLETPPHAKSSGREALCPSPGCWFYGTQGNLSLADFLGPNDSGEGIGMDGGQPRVVHGSVGRRAEALLNLREGRQ